MIQPPLAENYLIASTFQTLEQPRSFYLFANKWDRVGLMQAFDWKTRLHDTESRQPVTSPHSAPISASRYIGTYIHLNPVHTRMLTVNATHLSALWFVQYLQYLAVADLIDAALTLRSRGIVDEFDVEADLQLTKRLFQQYPEFASFSPIAGTPDFAFAFLNDIRDAATLVAHHLWNQMAQQTGGHRVPIRDTGTIVGGIAPQILRLCGDWTYKLCLDATHNLPPQYQIALNTLFASTYTGVFYTLAASDAVNVELTYADEMSLTDRDRCVIDIRTPQPL